MGTLVNMSTNVMQPTPQLAETISNKLAELRNCETGVPQRELAEKIGIPTMVLNRAINGTSTPTADAIVKIAKFYSVTVDWILGVEGAPKRRRTKIVR